MRIIPPRLLARPCARASRRAQGGWIVNPYRLAVGGGGGGGGDPYFSSVVQLAHFDGTNGSTTLTNSSSGGNTMTVRGASTISTAQSKWGGASLRAPTTGTGAQAAEIADYGFAHGAVTMEGWVRLDSLVDYYVPFSFEQDGGSTACILRVTSAGAVRLFIDSGNKVTSSNGVISATTWHFISYCMAAGSVGVNRDHYLHVDGVHIGTWNSTYGWGSTGRLFVMQDAYGSDAVGYVDDFRVTKGVCRYTNSNYTPPAAAFPNS